MRRPRRSVIVVTATMAAIVPAAVAASAVASVSGAGSPAWKVTGHIRVAARIPVGRFPVGVAVNPRTNTVYVANAKNRTVSVRRQVGVAVPGKQREAQQHPAHRGAHPSPLRGSAAGQPRRPS